MNDGGPAFPYYQGPEGSSGMSLRDYFAAAALTGLLPSELPVIGAKPEDMIRLAFELADLAIAQRGKEQGK